MNNGKKLHRSSSDRIIAGVLGGISEFLGWQSSLVRILYIVLLLTPGVGFVAFLSYIVMGVIVPSDHSTTSFFNQMKSNFSTTNPDSQSRKVLHNVDEKDVNDHQKRGQS